MRISHVVRGAALLGASALFVSVPATASAQSQNFDPVADLATASDFAKEAPQSVANLAGGSLASAGLGDLGSTVAGGQCVAVDPALGSAASHLDVKVTSKDGAPGVAVAQLNGGSWFGQVNGTLHWVNEDTGAKGDAKFGPMGGDATFANLELETGAGHVTWSVEATQSGAPLLAVLPLSAFGGLQDIPLGSSAPFSTCTGAADID